MDKVSLIMTVYFEEAYWVGLVELQVENKLQVCKITFGKEPSEQVILDFMTCHFKGLMFSPVAKVKVISTKKVNPKRKQREARKQMQVSVSTKSQELLQQQYLESKEARKEKHKLHKDQKQVHLFTLKQQKRKEKHRGH